MTAPAAPQAQPHATPEDSAMAICKTCGQEFDLNGPHPCPGLSPAASDALDQARAAWLAGVPSQPPRTGAEKVRYAPDTTTPMAESREDGGAGLPAAKTAPERIWIHHSDQITADGTLALVFTTSAPVHIRKTETAYVRADLAAPAPASDAAAVVDAARALPSLASVALQPLVARLELLGAMPADEDARGRIGSYVDACRDAAVALRAALSSPPAASAGHGGERVGGGAEPMVCRFCGHLSKRHDELHSCTEPSDQDEQMAAMLAKAAEEAVPQQPVKPLDWQWAPQHLGDQRWAESAFGRYCMWDTRAAGWHLQAPDWKVGKRIGSREEAEAAAQADFAARVRACLVQAPPAEPAPAMGEDADGRTS